MIGATDDCKLLVKSFDHYWRATRQGQEVTLSSRWTLVAKVATDGRKKGTDLHKFSSASPLMDLFCRTSTNRRRREPTDESRRVYGILPNSFWDNINSYNSADKAFQTCTHQQRIFYFHKFYLFHIYGMENKSYLKKSRYIVKILTRDILREIFFFFLLII